MLNLINLQLVRSTIKKGMRTIKHDGMIVFYKRFLVFLSHNSLSCGKYYLFEKSLIETNYRKPTPIKSDFTLKIIRTSDEVDKLVDEGFKFGLFQNIHDIKDLLVKRKILFCVFKKEEWAHSSWLSLEDNSIIDPFFKKQSAIYTACVGICSTSPSFRGLGLYPLVLSYICEYLKENGKLIVFISTRKENIASIKGINKAGFTVYGRGYHLNIGFWTLWKQIIKK